MVIWVILICNLGIQEGKKGSSLNYVVICVYVLCIMCGAIQHLSNKSVLIQICLYPLESSHFNPVIR